MTTPPLPPEDSAAPEPERGLPADQDPSMTSHLAAEHLTLDELADLSVGELPVDASAAAEVHLAECEPCRSELAQLTAEMGVVTAGLSGLSDLLGFDASARDIHRADAGNPSSSSPGAAPGFLPPMPVTVAARLDRVLAAESESRQVGGGSGSAESDSGVSGSGTGGPRAGESGVVESGAGTVVPLVSAPLKAPATASYVKQTGVVRLMLAAAVAAAVVGFGGYFVSASAGLNEPSTLSPTQIHPDALASQAGQLAQRQDLDPHLFSAAWRCARKVTTGRITGITVVYVNGEPHNLVYTRSGDVTYATLVSGCDTDNPTAGRPVKLTE